MWDGHQQDDDPDLSHARSQTVASLKPGWRERRDDPAARGLPYSALDVDTDNASGALRLYSKVGMQRRPASPSGAVL